MDALTEPLVAGPGSLRRDHVGRYAAVHPKSQASHISGRLGDPWPCFCPTQCLPESLSAKKNFTPANRWRFETGYPHSWEREAEYTKISSGF